MRHLSWIGPLAFVPSTLLGQDARPLVGTVYDSLLHAPLSGADVWLAGTARHVATDTKGRFQFDSVAAGRYTLQVSHPGLDSAGVFTLAIPVTVSRNSVSSVQVATPSRATLWRRRCGRELKAGSDSGLIFGVVQDAQTHAHLAGAALLLEWFVLAKTGDRDVELQPHDLTVRTDSTGTYYACGIATDWTIGLRGYAQRDSSGRIDVQLGPRGISRQDLRIALKPAREGAVLTGRAVTDEGVPVSGGRVAVREGASTAIDDGGTFTIRGVSPGTQWVTIRAIGSAPSEQAVDLGPGDSVWLPVTLGPVPVTLATVYVTARQAQVLSDFQSRHHQGLGYFRDESDIANAPSLRSVLRSIPSVRVTGRSVFDLVVLLPTAGFSPDGTPIGWCQPVLFVDGVWLRDAWDELASYRPKDLVGLEVYPRGITVPLQFQVEGSECGAVVIWTKYLQ
ncbi:MAG TPA: carboxypeptidase regulatory-like domain-containing protein [Gemmatimonadales bacterium]